MDEEGRDAERMPRHVAIIMDGNGRWANARDLPRTAGHAAGEHSLFETVRAAVDLGIEWLTVYAFSTENWSRPPDEVEFLMEFNESLLLRRRDEVDELGVRVRFIGLKGDERVPERVQRRMDETATMTVANTTMNLVFAFDYGGRTEIAGAARRIAAHVASGDLDPDDVDEKTVAAHLDMPDMPDPDVVIRTSGEQRLSNFLLWQSAYAEFVFSPVLWPEFDRTELERCIAEYQGRRRRFGGVR